MSQLYLSTGRKPSALGRRVARLLCLIFNAKYENRGKKSVDEICARAEKFGCTRIAFIYEKKGNPTSIQFYDEANGWLEEELRIFGVNLPDRDGRIPKTVKFISKDADGKKIMQLFNLENEIDDSPSSLEAHFYANRMDFIQNNSAILGIKCGLSKKEGAIGE